MFRPISLNAVKSGITRLREKGAANPESLWDATNCFINNTRMPEIRPGSVVDADLDPLTKGLFGYHGKLYTFCHTTVTMPASSKYVLVILINPVNASVALKDVHFAADYVGAPYVVAEFADGSSFHYWLETQTTWKANTTYQIGDLVQPTVPNGLSYRPSRLGNAYAAWTPGAPRAVADRVEPTTYNGFYYEVVTADGTNPTSGLVEPTWPTNDGETVIEETNTSTVISPVPTTVPPATDGSTGSGTSYGPNERPGSGTGSTSPL
jgi:hypothetical protein